VLNRIVLVALLAGSIAGLAASALQQALVVPLIVLAERYETDVAELAVHSNRAPAEGAAAATSVPSASAAPAHVHQAINEPRGPFDLGPALLTAVSTVGVSIGYTLMMLALLQAAGDRVIAPTTLAWAAGGFAITSLAPSLGLAPELPGSAVADLTLRQLWWAGTALATAGGLWLLLRHRTVPLMAAGAVLLALPHVIGAPQPAAAFSYTVPSELAAAFAARSIGIQAALWLAIGLLSSYFWARSDRTGVS
jgi:cobalt transporter subunit CbtA